MGWETRKNGGRYYTHSKKVDGRVVREYVGTGDFAELMAQADTLERQQRIERQAALKAERDKDRETEKALTDYYEAIQRTTESVLIDAGYHKHKGQWRRKRGT